MNKSPWEKLTPLTQKRVNNVHQHVIHWIMDASHRVGIMIRCKESSFTEGQLIQLKGIQVELDKTNSPNKLLLILNNRDDIEIFEIICRDLISVAQKNENDQDLILKIAQRLIRWKKLLQQDIKSSLSLQKQMGLFGELTFIRSSLKDKIGLEEAVRRWTGPQFSKQDFILENSVIEIKTYRTSNEKIIEISSKEQLYSPKENLFLVAFALSESSVGYTVKDLVNIIFEDMENQYLKDIFIEKVETYGYIPELMEESLINFTVDESNYYKVENEFPRIVPKDLTFGIKHLKYTIDLISCSSFEVMKDELKF